jgi:uncharacterized membrane protein
MKNKTKIIIASIIALGYPAVSMAALEKPQDILDLMQSAVTYMYSAFYILAVGFILWAAFNYLQGGTNPKKIETAKAQLKYAVIAIVIALVASGASAIIQNFIKP